MSACVIGFDFFVFTFQICGFFSKEKLLGKVKKVERIRNVSHAWIGS